ncbi:MAG: MMPL family transporter [Glaciimonas sp.]|nr:MMPL family transporter [Glaciimonas sp.]
MKKKNAAGAAVFSRENFQPGWIGTTAFWIFSQRLPLLIAGIVMTILLGLSATRLGLNAEFSKMIPQGHEYTDTFSQYQKQLGGGNRVLIAVRSKHGDIFSTEYLAKLRTVQEGVFYIPGVERASVTSIFSPNVVHYQVVENGFEGGPVIATDYDGSEQALAKVKDNIVKSNWVGRIVSNDFKSSMIVAELMENDPETGEHLNIYRFGNKLEDLRRRFEGEDVSIHIIGFAKASSDIVNGTDSIAIFFAVTFVVTAILLFWYSNSAMLTAWALVAAMIPVVWLLGIMPLAGLTLDPLSILLPFLIFAIGVSHAVQMTNAWKQEVIRGADGQTASTNCFIKLFIPGSVALLANALGFVAIAFVPVQIVKDLVITATIGVSIMIATNKVLLPILLSYMKAGRGWESSHAGHESGANRMWEVISRVVERRNALAITAFGAMALVAAALLARDLKVGDLGKGIPELRQEARYNLDAEFVTANFSLGVDVLGVIVEPQNIREPCLEYATVDHLDRFESAMRQVEGVESVRGLGGAVRTLNVINNEENIKWGGIPETRAQLGQYMTDANAKDKDLALFGCQTAQVLVYLKDHQASTLAKVVSEIKSYREQFSDDSIKFRLATGSAGIMAATNEVVKSSDAWVNLALFGSVSVLCLLTFRSIPITVCIVLPLVLVTVLCNAIMALLHIGLKVNTLPVVALGVGVGIDYGIYMFERIRHEAENNGLNLRDAFQEALWQRGTASVFTALTMAIGVGFWGFSDLKFQADMGLLLAFMFVVNLLAAIILSPALAGLLWKPARHSKPDAPAAKRGIRV